MKEKNEVQNMYKNLKQGFTLLELLVVVVIIGILAAIALPKYQLAVDKAKYTQAMNLLAAINQAQNRYQLANGNFTKNFYDLDIDMPASGQIINGQGADNDTYYDKFGYCWLHSTGYGQCNVAIGKGYAWYFLFWDNDSRSSNKRSCWAQSKDNVRANRLCQALTGKTTGTDNGNYKIYDF